MARAVEVSPATQVGEWIYDAMKSAGLNQQELADRCGIARPTVSRIVNSKRGNIRIDTLFLIIEGCGFELTGLHLVKRR